MDEQSNIVGKSDPRDSKHTEVYSEWQLRSDINYRWKRNIIILLVLGVPVSLVVHLIVAFLLALSERNTSISDDSGDSIVIEFAVFETETLSELPESTEIESSDAAPAALDSPLTAETVLEATSSTSQLMADQSIVPTLGGAVGGDLGTGMGGSGGASFFGISSEGGRFCYIMDISASMNQDNRLQGATRELEASLLKLTNFSQFYILFYSSDVTEPPTQHGWNTARRSTLTRIIKEIYGIKAKGGTNPTPAFKMAMELNPLPDVIFFLTDADSSNFPRTLVSEIRNMLPTSQRIVIHTVAFGKSAAIEQLKEIATLTGGQFKFVK